MRLEASGAGAARARRGLYARVVAATAVVALWSLSCATERGAPPTRETGSSLPALADPETIARAGALADSGYGLMEAGDFAAAIAVMKASEDALPASRYGPYNLACAYAKSGQSAPALEALGRAVKIGWDDLRHISSDPDLAPLRETPEFQALLTEVTQNLERGLAPLAQGLPQVAAPPPFASQDSLEAWLQSERQRLQRGSRHLASWQVARLEADLEARGIAARRALTPPDPEFDEGMARVRAMGNLFGAGQSWGPVADGTVKEVKDYLARNPGPEERGEAAYWAGLAEYCRALPSPEDPAWAGAVQASRAWLAQVPAGVKSEGVAAAWQLMFDLGDAGEQKEALQPRLREFAQKYREDRAAMGVAGNYFGDDLIRAEWPIPFEAVDMSGKKVTLDEYRGKPVLLCYWATW